MASGYFLDGSMIERSSARKIDERVEARVSPASETAVLDFRGRRHVVRMVNVSSSGAMVSFAQLPNIGEEVVLQLLDHGRVPAQVRWVRDGRVGLVFLTAGGSTS